MSVSSRRHLQVTDFPPLQKSLEQSSQLPDSIFGLRLQHIDNRFCSDIDSARICLTSVDVTARQTLGNTMHLMQLRADRSYVATPGIVLERTHIPIRQFDHLIPIPVEVCLDPSPGIGMTKRLPSQDKHTPNLLSTA